MLKKETEKTIIYANVYTVVQIFENLLNNAIKYTKQRKVELKINRNENNRLVVEVFDTGIGISEEFFPDLFNTFTREEGDYTRRFEGNGFGLVLVKKYVEMNRAEIKLQCKKGFGTTFMLIFSDTGI